MKALSFVAVLLFAAAVNGNAEMMKKIMTDCQAKIGATADDVAAMLAHKMPENQKQKCMFACCLTAMNMVNN